MSRSQAHYESRTVELLDALCLPITSGQVPALGQEEDATDGGSLQTDWSGGETFEAYRTIIGSDGQRYRVIVRALDSIDAVD